MQPKKSDKADLSNKRLLFFEIGMVVSLAVVNLFFVQTRQDKEIQVAYFVDYMPDIELMDVTWQRENGSDKAPAKVVINPGFVQPSIVAEDVRIEIPEWVEDDEFIEVPRYEILPDTLSEPDIYVVAEFMPKFKDGGVEKFYRWVRNRIRYPPICLENNIEGKVSVTFLVDKQGILTNIEVQQSPNRYLSEEVVRVLSRSPRWEPAKQKNKAVDVGFGLKVDFRIVDNDF